MTDLDQSGHGVQKIRTYLGPSLGWTDELIQPMVDVTTAGVYTVKPGDSVLLVNVAGAITIQLPDVRQWIQQTASQPATGFERSITVKDQGGNANNFNITIAPFGTQKIDNVQAPILITVNRASSTLYPLPDMSGWYVKSTAVGGPGGSGDVFKAGDNTFTGLNKFLGTIQVPTTDPSDNSLNAASTAFVKSQGYVSSISLNAYALLESPSFTGVPRAPTPSNATNDNTIATTAFVKSNLAQYQPLDDDLTAISALTGANVIYYRSGVGAWTPVTIGANLTFISGVLSATGGGGSGDVTQAGNNTFTGVNVFNGSTSAVTVTSTDNSTKVATTAYVKSQGYLLAGALTPYATLNNPIFTGDPQAPTPLLTDSDTSIATTGFVKGVVSGYQPLDGDLTALSASTGVNTIYYRSAPDTWSPVTIGGNMTFSGGVLNATSPSGTVNSSGGGYSTSVIVGYADTTGNVIRALNLGTGLSIAGTTINLDADLVSLAGQSSTNAMFYRSAADTWSPVTIGSGLTFSGGTLTASATGGGNVSNIGTPTNGQYARWTNAITIAGVPPATVLTDIGGQPLDGDLTAIAALTGTNTIYYRSGADTWSPVVIGSGMNFAGGTLSATGSLADAPNDGVTYARKSAAWVSADAAYVKKPGDTMTGNLTITSNTNAFDSLFIQGTNLPGIKMKPSSGGATVNSFLYQQGNSFFLTGDSPTCLAADLVTGIVNFPVSPTSVTPTAGDSSTKLATTAFVSAAVSGFSAGATIADLPPSASQGKLWWESDSGTLFISYNDGNSTQWVGVAGAAIGAPINSPVFTGDPQAPTAAPGDNDNSIATTAFVAAAVGSSGFSTGDVKLTLKTSPDPGWVMFNDGSIGDAGSGSTYAASDAFPLFNLLFSNTADTDCPLQTSSGSATTRAAQGSSGTAWGNKCRMFLPKVLGRALSGAGSGAGLSTWRLGQATGVENNFGNVTFTMTEGQLPPHFHYCPDGIYFVAWPGSGQGWGVGAAEYGVNDYRNTMNTGSGLPISVNTGYFSITQPTVALNVMVKL